MANVYTCVGTRMVDFKGSDGSQVNGMNLFFTYEDPNIQGVGVDKVFVSAKRMMELSFVPAIGAACQLSYNKYGKVSDITAV